MRAASEWIGSDSFGPPAVLNFVVDANVVLQHLGYLVRERRNPTARSSIQEVADAGVVRFFGPFWLAEEVDHKIPEFAALRGIEEALLRIAWNEYCPHLYLFRADPVPDIEGVVDPKDLPYAYAQQGIGADAVVTEDPHLLKSSVPTLLTKLTHRELRDWARRRAVSDSIAVAGYGTAMAGVGIAGSAAQDIAKAIAKRPLLGGLLIAAGGVLWWWDSKRKKETGRSPTGEIVRAIGEAVGDLADAYRIADKQAHDNMKVIRDQIGQPSRTLVQWLLTTCIVAREPVSEAELIRRIVKDGFRRPEIGAPPGTAMPDQRNLREARLAYKVGQILRNDNRFVWTGTGWTTSLLQRPPAFAGTPPVGRNSSPTEVNQVRSANQARSARALTRAAPRRRKGQTQGVGKPAQAGRKRRLPLRAAKRNSGDHGRRNRSRDRRRGP